MSGCWDGLVLLKLFFSLFVSERGAHGKVHQEIKAAKVIFLTPQLWVYVVVVYRLPVSPGRGISFSGGVFAPWWGFQGLVKQRQKAMCLL